MAKRRMITKDIFNDDRFCELTHDAQLLYIYINMEADDDGLCGQVKKIMRANAFPEDAFEELTNGQFILWIDGVAVVKHWRLSNTIDKSKYHPSIYEGVKEKIQLDENTKEYVLITCGRKRGTKSSRKVPEKCPQVSIGEVSTEEISLDNSSPAEEEDCEKNAVREIVDYLNEKAETRFRYDTENTKRLIRARMREGHTAQEFREVIDKKCREWKGTKYEKYLRPATLFDCTKFEEYLNEKNNNCSESNSDNRGSFSTDDFFTASLNRVRAVCAN